MDGSVLEEKSSFKMLGLTLSFKLDWSFKFLHYLYCKNCRQENWNFNLFYEVFLKVALYLYKSTIHPCIEYCCHVWAGAPSCYKKEYAGMLVLDLLLLLNPWLIAAMWPAQVFSIIITVVDVLQNWLNWFHFLFLEGGLLVILIDCMIFLSPFLDVTRMSMFLYSHS